MICESCGQTVPEVEKKTVKAGDLAPGTFYSLPHVPDTLRLRFSNGFADVARGMAMCVTDSDKGFDVYSLTFAEAQATAKEYDYSFPPPPEPIWGTPPCPEPPPLTLKDINPGEWFRFVDGDYPCLRLGEDNMYICFMSNIISGYRNPVCFTIRLTPAEARELAKENGHTFPF